MVSGHQETSKDLRGIRDMALLLSLGNDYLCEGEFLKKAGLAIDTHLKELKTDISSLKKQFPGKFVNEVDTDQALEEIHGMAARLQDPDKEIRKKCSAGELGLELENCVNALMDMVNTTRMRVEGDVEGLTKTESILSYFGWIKSIGQQIFALFNSITKLFGAVFAVSVILFAYLFGTMESEKGLLKEIDQSRNTIQTQLEVLSRNKAEKEGLSKEINALSKGELSRQDKVKIMESNVKIHKLDEKAHDIELEIDRHERRIKEIEKKILQLRKKSFLQRLLRQ